MWSGQSIWANYRKLPLKSFKIAPECSFSLNYFNLDLIIGAFNSNAVIMLRARPIISVSTYLEEAGLHGIDPGTAGCELDPDSSHACFNFKACFQLDSEETNQIDMKIKFTIVAEPKKAVSRVWLSLAEMAGNQDSKSSKVEHMLVIQVKWPFYHAVLYSRVV